MRFPAQILKDRYAEQLMKMDLRNVQFPEPDDEITSLGRAIQKMFAENRLKRMWIDRETQEVFCE